MTREDGQPSSDLEESSQGDYDDLVDYPIKNAAIQSSYQGDEEFHDAIRVVLEGNSRLNPHFEHLRRRPFFRYFAVDLLSSCGYMPSIETPCGMDKCEITPAEDVPRELRARDEREHSFQLDGWARWDMPGDFTDYYDLVAQGERYTDYNGTRVWRFVHERIAFQLQLDDPDNAWKNDFNRLISGMHAEISVHIIEGLPEAQRLAEYRRRLRDQPGAVANLHFGYMLFLCAMRQATPRLTGCTYMGDAEAVLPAMRAVCFDPLLSEYSIQAPASPVNSPPPSPAST
mmetsp:Transcript_70817/g.189071  ORF Transcript_70817/g.189071 Transcript_70817/m.189071 type:complete len:286 (+) Transcript_70817:292-1149(+)